MNCTLIQRRLLAAEQPDQPSAEVKSHLAQCAACRAWQRRLVEVERQIPLLPVPPSTAKGELLQRILSPLPGDAALPALAERPALRWSSEALGPKERGLRKLSLAFALAAALLLFALGWWAWPHNAGTPPTTPRTALEIAQEKLEDRLGKVLQEDAPRERVLRLADLAEEVHGEARQMMDNTENLDLWARFYSRVSDHLSEQARALPPAERPILLRDIASRLSQTESNASRLAAELKPTAPRSAASFDQIALAAKKCERDLRDLAHG